MSKKLQDFDFDKSHYERPAQKWVCGRLEQGCPCHVGPDKKGRCRAVNDKLYECTPWRDEDRWKCSRPKSLGGACEDGPSPTGTCCRQIPICQPKLSHRAKRGRTALYAIMTATAIIFVFMFGIYTKDFASPGNLTTPHSAIVAKVTSGLSSESDDCSICHTAGKGDALSWVKRSFSGHENHMTESAKCLKCHKQAGDTSGNELKSLALNIHGIEDQKIQASSEKVASKIDEVELFSLGELQNIKSSVVTFFAKRDIIKSNTDGNINYHQVACATCHREHHGRNFNLTALTNEQCQTCHSIKFASFANGHPVFEKFPYDRRTRIMFDHNTHFGEYFAKAKSDGTVENPPSKCNDCHKLDDNNHLMVVKKFEDTCIQCHQKDILKEDDEIPFIRFSGIDSASFYKASRAAYKKSKDPKMRPKFSNWPSIDEEADGEYTDFMRLLLSNEPELKDEEIIEYLEEWIDATISDATGENGEEELKAINAYVTMIQRLVDEIAKHDNEKLKERLEKALKISISNEEVNSLFPNLSKMLQVVQAKMLPPINPKKKSRFQEFSFENPDLPIGWYLEDFILKYRPAKHSDPVMKSWLDLLAKSYNKDKDMSLDINKDDDPANDIHGNTKYAYDKMNRCLKCHSVDSASDGTRVINWRPNAPTNKGRFNKFSHKPHLALLDDVGCVQCHTLKPMKGDKDDPNIFVKADFNNIFKGLDPHNFISNFKFINKDLCSKCHVASAAGNKCTKCHNYHVNPFAPALNMTIQEASKKSDKKNLEDMKKIVPEEKAENADNEEND